MRYRVLKGIDFTLAGAEVRLCPAGTCGPDCRFGGGPHASEVDILPENAIPSLIECGAIEPVEPLPLAEGGFIPAVPGGRVIRVAEEGEEIVPVAPARRRKER